MSYELQAYALSPVRPTPRALLARTAESGLEVELVQAPGAEARLDDAGWTRLLLRSSDAEKGGFLVESSPDLERMKDAFREDRTAGDSIPEQVLDAGALYVLELDDESPGGEDHQAAFVVTAWALAGLTEAVVFDPQEEFFADADTFWAVITDESLGDEDGDGACDDDDDESGDDGGKARGASSDDDSPRTDG